MTFKNVFVLTCRMLRNTRLSVVVITCLEGDRQTDRQTGREREREEREKSVCERIEAA